MAYLTMAKMISNVAFYDKFKKRFMPAGDSKYSGFNNLWRRVLVAFTSGTVTLMLSYPFELMYTRIAADMNGRSARRLYTNTFDCFNLTQLEGGFRNLYGGSTVALFSIVPSTLLMIPLYDFFQTNQGGNTPQDLVNRYVGPKLMAGFMTMMLCYPLDTIKRCLMIVGSRGYSTINRGILNTISEIHRVNGMRGFYRGIHLAALKVGPSIYIQFLLYDFLKSHSSLAEKEPSLGLKMNAMILNEAKKEKVQNQESAQTLKN